MATFDNATVPASLAIDAVTDAVYLVWGPADEPWYVPPSLGPLLLSVSRDRGVNWTFPVNVLQNGSQGSRPQVAAYSDSVVVAFSTVVPSGPFIAAVSSQDGGRSWGNATPVAPPEPCGKGPQPSIAASPIGTFAVSWTSETGSLGCSERWTDLWGNSTEVWSAASSTRGRTFSPPVRVSEPPAWMATSFGDALAFDDASRPYVAWHSITSAWNGSVYVANSEDFGGTFGKGSFTTLFHETGGNSTAQENLAAGLNGTVYLVWKINELPPGADNSTAGIFVRRVAGEATGQVVLNEPLGPEMVEIDVRDAATGAMRARLPWTGSPLSIPELPPIAYEVWLHAGNVSARAGTMAVRPWGVTTFTVLVGQSPIGSAFPWATAGLVATLAAVGAALAEFYHRRLPHEEEPQRKVRRLIFEYVHNNPGSSFTAVRNALGLQNGVAAYHLGVLEKRGLVHSESRRRHRWYYPNGDVSLWRDLPLSPLQSSLLTEVRRTPGIGIRELARTLGRRASPVAYNVKALAREGLLRIERTGRKAGCFPSDSEGTPGF